MKLIVDISCAAHHAGMDARFCIKGVLEGDSRHWALISHLTRRAVPHVDLRAFALRARRDPSAAWVDRDAQHVVRVLLEEPLRVRVGVEHHAQPRSVVDQLAGRQAEEVVAAVVPSEPQSLGQSIFG